MPIQTAKRIDLPEAKGACLDGACILRPFCAKRRGSLRVLRWRASRKVKQRTGAGSSFREATGRLATVLYNQIGDPFHLRAIADRQPPKTE